MAHLFLTNVDASDDEIRDFLSRYGFPPFDGLQHFPGDGSHPAVLLRYREKSSYELRRLQPRIHLLFWKNRRITAYVPTERFL